MDILGLVDTLIVDYKRREVMIRLRDANARPGLRLGGDSTRIR
jgi:hypothetical protein